MRACRLAVSLASALWIGGVAEAQTKPAAPDLEARPVDASADPVNRKSAASTVDGLVLVVTIDGSSIRLDGATPARIPRAAAERKRPAGDRVTAVGLAGGARVSETSSADAVLNAEEGGGLVRASRRQVTLSLPAPRALDTVEVSAPATGASARLDVRAAYAPYASSCKGESPDPRFCPGPERPESPR
jgi:hypothetical protein